MIGLSFTTDSASSINHDQPFGVIHCGTDAPPEALQALESGGFLVIEPPPNSEHEESMLIQVPTGHGHCEGKIYTTASDHADTSCSPLWGKWRRSETDKWQPLATITSIGRGHLVRLALNLSDVYSDTKLEKRPPYGTSLLTAEMNRNDKWLIDVFVYGLLYKIFALLRIPFIHKWFYPGSAKGVSLFRIDVDNVRSDLSDLRQIVNCIDRHKLKTTFYVNTGNNSDRLPRILEMLHGTPHASVGNHGHKHMVFDKVEECASDICAAEAELSKASHYTKEFAGPCGAYTPQLGETLAQFNFSSSSEFQLDWDSYPNMRPGSVVNIPVHPVCAGLGLDFNCWNQTLFFRANYMAFRIFRRLLGVHLPVVRRVGVRVSAQDFESYYADIVRLLRRRSLPVHIYGHPHDLGRPVYRSVLEAICRLLESTDDYINLSAHELASFIRMRSKTPITYDFDAETRTAIVRLSAANSQAFPLIVNACGTEKAKIDSNVNVVHIEPVPITNFETEEY